MSLLSGRPLLGVLLILGGIFSSCSGPGTTSGELYIATAANMQYAMEALAQSFSQSTGIACELIIGSSGKLTAQIVEGAPFDVFVSADMRYPEEVFRSGRGVDSPQVYAYGKLVLWSREESILPSLEILESDQIQHIAMANPQNAPYGIAAASMLAHFGMDSSLQDKLVFGESIAQTNQFISTQAAQVGFTAKSVVLSPNIRGKGRWIELPEESYPPIEQGAIVLKRTGSDPESAQAFYDFLFSKKAHEILQDFGYAVPQ